MKEINNDNSKLGLLNTNNLPLDILEILDNISENVHIQWMSGRLAAGWRLGSERNDRLKQHPSLIPYEELSEEEKEYDRQTAMTVINYLLTNGYDIIKRD